MSAPGGLCGSCGMPLKWCFAGSEMMVHCVYCYDLFGVDLAYEKREGARGEVTYGEYQDR